MNTQNKKKKKIRHNKQFFIIKKRKQRTKYEVCIQTGLEEVPPNYKVASLDTDKYPGHVQCT